jgi:leucyl aminopeptidase
MGGMVMKTVDQTLEQLDTTLDTVDELLNELPLTREQKHALTSKVYDLWMDVEQLMVDTVADDAILVE